jgi:hypothetical protein
VWLRNWIVYGKGLIREITAEIQKVMEKFGATFVAPGEKVFNSVLGSRGLDICQPSKVGPLAIFVYRSAACFSESRASALLGLTP